MLGRVKEASLLKEFSLLKENCSWEPHFKDLEDLTGGL